jgi:hypothetical protein
MKDQDYIITAKALCDAFIENKGKAEREYGNRIMKISGYTVHVGPDMFGLPCVELSEEKESQSRTICLLPFTDYLKLRNVSKGDEVIMEGEVRSIYDKDRTIVVKECKIVEVKKK